MATTLPSDLYDPSIATAYMAATFFENLDIYRKFFGEAASAPIVVNPYGLVASAGQFVNKPKFKRVNASGGMWVKRDVTSNGTLTPQSIIMRNDLGVRCCLSSGNIGVNQSDFMRGGYTKETFSAEIGRQAGVDLLTNLISKAIAVVKATVQTMTSSLHTYSPYVTSSTKALLTQTAILQGKATLGDAMQNFSGGALIMRSDCFTDLGIFQAGQLVQGLADLFAQTGSIATLGMNYALRDEANLKVTNGGSYKKFYTLGVGPGGLEIDIGNVMAADMWPNPQTVNFDFLTRFDVDILIYAPGFAWDSANAGANPDTSDLLTAANWVPKYSDHREVKNWIIEHNCTTT